MYFEDRIEKENPNSKLIRVESYFYLKEKKLINRCDVNNIIFLWLLFALFKRITHSSMEIRIIYEIEIITEIENQKEKGIYWKHS